MFSPSRKARWKINKTLWIIFATSCWHVIILKQKVKNRQTNKQIKNNIKCTSEEESIGPFRLPKGYKALKAKTSPRPRSLVWWPQEWGTSKVILCVDKIEGFISRTLGEISDSSSVLVLPLWCRIAREHGSVFAECLHCIFTDPSYPSLPDVVRS